MKKWFAGAAVLGAALVVWGLWPDSTTQDRKASHPAEKADEAPAVARKPGCEVTGRANGAELQRVLVRSEHHGLDMEAQLEGATFSVKIPLSGPVAIIGVSTEGQTVSVHEPCRLGTARAVLRFEPAAAKVSRVEGACRYLDTGVPVFGATVTARVGASTYSGQPSLSRSTLSAEDGSFSLALKPGSYRVLCAKDRDESEAVLARVVADTTTNLPAIYIEPTAGISGVVMNAEQVPVSGVMVTARAVRRKDQAQSGRSDDEGRFFIEGLLPGTVKVEAHGAEGSAEQEALAQVELPYAEVQLILRPGLGATRLQGSVVDEQGVRLEGVWVDVRDARSQRRRSVTDAEGNFKLGGLQPGPAQVELSRNEQSSEQALELRPGDMQVQLRLRAKCDAIVEITGAPANTMVQLSAQSPGSRVSTQATGPADAPLRLRASPGPQQLFARLAGGVTRTASTTADLCAGVTKLDMSARSGARVHVSTVDEADEAVGQVGVWLRGPSRDSGTTDAEGKLSFEGLAAGSYRVMTRDGEDVGVEVKDIEVSVKLVVPRRVGVIEGRVTSSSGPVEGARVLAACADSGRSLSLAQAPLRARTDAQGAFSFSPDDGGICRVRAEHTPQGRSRDVTLTVGAPPAELRLVGGAQLSGVVRTKSGEPVSNYRLTVQPSVAERERRSVQVYDEQGRYAMNDLLPGPVTVTVEGSAGRSSRQAVLQEGVETTLDITLLSHGRVEGRVVSDGQPVPGVRVSLRTIQRRAAGIAQSGADGRFSTNVPSGQTLRAYLQMDGYYPLGTPSFTLNDEGRVDLGDLNLEARGGDEEKEGGIGVAFAGAEEGIRIIRFTDDSPAREAGAEVGDLIVSIDGAPFGGEPLINWVVRLRGLPGTSVNLGLVRGDRGPFPVTVVRRVIGLPPVGSHSP